MSDTTFTGPVKAGNVLNSDGTGTLASVGGSTGTANVGYCVMGQSAVCSFASATLSTTSIVIPAQSQILNIYAMVTTTESAATFTVGDTAGSASVLSGGGSLATAGPVNCTPTSGALWDNVGSTDVQVTVTASGTGSGVMTLTVTYLQAINLAS